MEPSVGLSVDVLCLGHHTPLLAPRTAERFVLEFNKDPRRLLSGFKLRGDMENRIKEQFVLWPIA